jgi:hypothetical protein
VNDNRKCVNVRTVSKTPLPPPFGRYDLLSAAAARPAPPGFADAAKRKPLEVLRYALAAVVAQWWVAVAVAVEASCRMKQTCPAVILMMDGAEYLAR